MRPINYERHCAQCHPLFFGEELFRFDARLDLGGPLPHDDPRIVRDALRNRLMAYAKAHPERVAPGDPEPPRLPTKPPLPTQSARDRWEWVEQRLTEVEAVVFGKASDVRYPQFMQGCIYCHDVERDTAGAADGDGVLLEWTIAPPDVPARWFPHSRFRHDRHDSLEFRGRRLECTDCHYITPPERVLSASANSQEEAGTDGHRRPGSVFASDSTRDVLLPSIETCRDCHGGPDRRVFTGPARSECVECHVYHHATRSRE
jgi:hypothetical protein